MPLGTNSSKNNGYHLLKKSRVADTVLGALGTSVQICSRVPIFQMWKLRLREINIPDATQVLVFLFS